jgi:hypothetical protein
MSEFLDKIGKLVSKAAEIKVGDIVGHGYIATGYTYETVRLYYVESVDLSLYQVKCFGPGGPCVYFKAPHIGLTIGANGMIGRTHIFTPMPGSMRKWKWSEMTLEEALKGVSEDPDGLDSEYKRVAEDECFDLYLIQDEGYKKLGALIPEVEVPSWGFLCQTTKGEKPIYDFVDAVKDDLKKARELYQKIELKNKEIY